MKRFLASTLKIEAAFNQQDVVAQIETRIESVYFFVKSGKILRRILLEEILFFSGEKEYVRLVTDKEELLLYRRLKDIQEQLAGHFVRVHNSYIVNTRRLDRVQDNHIHIGTKQIPVSEKFREGFMEVIRQRTF